MRRILLLPAFAIMTLLQSCVVSELSLCAINNEERIRINADNSGEYILKIDLSDMIENMGHELPEIYSHINIDTSVDFDEPLEEDTRLSDEEKNMFKGGSAKIKFNTADHKQTITIKLIFANPERLDYTREHIFAFIGLNTEYVFHLLEPARETDDVMKSIETKLGTTSPAMNFHVDGKEQNISKDKLTQQKGLNPVGKVYSLQITENRISNSIKDLRQHERAISSNKFLAAIKQEEAALLKVIFKTTFTTTRQIRNYKGPVDTVSADKKTITFKNSLFELLNKPLAAEYVIDF